MRLLVVSHKECWPSSTSESGYATDGGFPFQMRALSELFDSTRIIAPCQLNSYEGSDITGKNLKIVPISRPKGVGISRKLGLFPWLTTRGWQLFKEVHMADAIHAPIPGDIGTIGMLLAVVLRKPLFVRHCGNWFVQRTVAEHFWKWFMEKMAGGRNVMLATGGNSGRPPSNRNDRIQWIFSTSLTSHQLEACSVERRGFPKDRIRIVIVCRQEQEKGTGEVIKSLPLLVKRFPQLVVDVVGDGSALQNFKHQAELLGVDDRVVFHGKVMHSRVIEILKQGTVFCYPTRASEGFPKVVLEALACGLPVVTTRVSVLPDLINSGCGILVEDTSPETLLTAISDILVDVDRYQALSQAAVSVARQYSLEAWRDAIGELLRKTWHRSLSTSTVGSSCVQPG